jgi:hypothetical protein
MKLAEGVGCDLTLILFSLSRKLVKRFAAEPRIQPLKVRPLIVEDSPSTTNLSGLPRACGRRIFSHGDQIPSGNLRQFDPRFGGVCQGSAQGSRPSRLRRLEPAHAGLPGSGPAIPHAQ